MDLKYLCRQLEPWVNPGACNAVVSPVAPCVTPLSCLYRTLLIWCLLALTHAERGMPAMAPHGASRLSRAGEQKPSYPIRPGGRCGRSTRICSPPHSYSSHGLREPHFPWPGSSADVATMMRKELNVSLRGYCVYFEIFQSLLSWSCPHYNA